MTERNITGFGLHVIICGNPVEGFEIYGPFASGDEDARIGNSDPHIPTEWWIAPLHAIEEEDAP